MPSRTYHEEISLPGSAKRYVKTRLWIQLFFLLFVCGLFFVLFHHYLPTYRDLWYDLRPSEKELVFERSDEMQFVDEKNGQFLIWYETYPDRYRFFNRDGFYGAGKERELADTEEKIALLRHWVDTHPAAVKAKESDKTQSPPATADIESKLDRLTEANKALEDKVRAQESDISNLVNRNKELTEQGAIPKQPEATPAPAIVGVVSVVAAAPPPANPDFYKHGAVIPPNPKPDAWFQSLTWGKMPPPPYHYNAGNGFFEIADNPESRIAPHPHLLLKSKTSGLYERPYLHFVKIHGAPPAGLDIPRLDDAYYDTLKRNFGAVFNFSYPYDVTLGGVPY